MYTFTSKSVKLSFTTVFPIVSQSHSGAFITFDNLSYITCMFASQHSLKCLKCTIRNSKLRCLTKGLASSWDN